MEMCFENRFLAHLQHDIVPNTMAGMSAKSQTSISCMMEKENVSRHSLMRASVSSWSIKPKVTMWAAIIAPRKMKPANRLRQQPTLSELPL